MKKKFSDESLAKIAAWIKANPWGKELIEYIKEKE